MSYGSSQKVQKVMVQPINLIFRCSSSGIQVLERLINHFFPLGTFRTELVLVFGCTRM